jgi:uncharacterized protein YjdB
MTFTPASSGRRACAGSSAAACRRVVTIACCTGVIASCGSAGDSSAPASSTPALTSLRVDFSTDTTETGLLATATATGLDQRGAPIGIGAVTWSSTSPAVAMVTPDGMITAVTVGTTMLVASSNGAQGRRLFTVVRPVVAHLLITPETARLVRGASLSLSTTAITVNGRLIEGRRVAFTTSDPTRATVTPAGLVAAVSPGDVVLTATSEGASASTALTVTAIPDSVQTVTVTPASDALTVGGTVQLSATLTDARGVILGGRAPVWTVTGIVGANVATFSSTGLVTATGPGTALIQAFSEGQNGAATIIVADNVDPSIVVTFALPVENALVGDTLNIIVNATAPNTLASVVAEVGTTRKTVRLEYRKVGALGAAYLWVGTLDVTDIHAGPTQILVTATDSRGGHGVATRQFQRDTRTGKGGSSQQPPSK